MFYKIVNGSISYGADTIIQEVDFRIMDGERLALIGRNGCGKTSLLKAIVGEIPMEEGTGESPFEVSSVGNPSFGYLRQMVFPDESISLENELLSLYSDAFLVETRLEKARKKMDEDPSEANVVAYSNVFDEFERIGGFDIQVEINMILTGLGFGDAERKKPLSAFSGGEKTRISLAELLLKKPDILLLDEPTNNLDIQSIAWLEDRLKDYPNSLVVVSHDRMFLDRIATSIIEIEWGEMKRYKGNYSAFSMQKRDEFEKMEKDAGIQKREIARLEAIVKKNIGHPTKANMAKSIRKKIEHMKLIHEPNPYDDKAYMSSCKPARRSGDKVLTCSELGIGYGPFPLQYVDFAIERKARLGIIGGNGIGKSTFLKTILGDIPKVRGRFFWGDSIDIGYFDQTMAETRNDISVYDAFRDEFPALSAQETRNALGSFGITGDDVFRSLGELSGGEKVRFLMCRIFKSRPNVLILDEPTNHVDIIGKESLEAALNDFEGTIILVSHDRYLISQVCNCLLVFEKDKTEFFKGTYREYEEKLGRIKPIAEKAKAKASPVMDSKKSHKREIERLENEISDLEDELKELRLGFEDESIADDFQKCRELDEDIGKLEKRITELSDKWAALVEEDSNSAV